MKKSFSHLSIKKTHENIDLLQYFSCGYSLLSCFFFFFTAVNTAGAADDTLERLRNITKMFTSKEDEPQQLKKMEKVAPE